jgi:hypothetical protein
VDPLTVRSRMLRCLLLDASAFEELRLSPSDTMSSVLLVFAASYTAGLGGLIWTFVSANYVDHLRFFVRSFLLGSAIQGLVFLLWVGVTGQVLERVFRVPARYTDLLRVMGYAFVPVGIQLFVFIPALDQPIGILALAVALYVSIFAVQSSTIASPGQAFVATILGFAAFCLILGILGDGTTDLAPGLIALDPNSLSVGLSLPLGAQQR